MDSLKSNKNPCVYFFFTDEEEEKTNKRSGTLNKRFVSMDFLGNNEKVITNKIKDALSNIWSDHFYLFEASEPIINGILGSDAYHLQAIKELNVDKTAIVWYRDRQLIYIDGYLKALSCSRKYILCLTDFYSRLLTNIGLLVSNNIVHNNIGFGTIVIDIGTFTNPILTNFKFSLDINRPDIGEYIKHFFIKYDHSHIQWPLEFHILSYLLTNKLDSLSFNNIQFVVSNVINSNTFLNTFGQKIVDEYKEDGLTYFSRYVNQSSSWIISDILKYYRTWDNYALSICYLKIIIDLYNTVKIKSKFLITFLKLLVGNIHSVPTKRLTVNNTTNKFANIMEECEITDFHLLVRSL